MFSKIKNIGHKLNLTVIFICTLLGVCFWFIGLPIAGYNKIMLNRAESCFEENFSRYELAYEKERAWNDQNYTDAAFQRSGEDVILFSKYGGISGPLTTRDRLSEICGIEWLNLENPGRPDQKVSVTAEAVIFDTTTFEPPFQIGLFFLGTAIAFFVLGKWLSWLFKP